MSDLSFFVLWQQFGTRCHKLKIKNVKIELKGTKVEKNMGPSMEPCGAPQLADEVSNGLIETFTVTVCVPTILTGGNGPSIR